MDKKVHSADVTTCERQNVSWNHSFSMRRTISNPPSNLQPTLTHTHTHKHVCTYFLPSLFLAGGADGCRGTAAWKVEAWLTDEVSLPGGSNHVISWYWLTVPIERAPRLCHHVCDARPGTHSRSSAVKFVLAGEGAEVHSSGRMRGRLAYVCCGHFTTHNSLLQFLILFCTFQLWWSRN